MITSYVHELFAFRHHFKWWVEMILEEWHWRQKEEPHVTLRDVLRERFEGNDKLVDELVNAIAAEEKVDFVEKLLAVYLIIGVFIGGWLSGFTAGRLGLSVDKGPRISKKQRYLFPGIGRLGVYDNGFSGGICWSLHF